MGRLGPEDPALIDRSASFLAPSPCPIDPALSVGCRLERIKRPGIRFGCGTAVSSPFQSPCVLASRCLEIHLTTSFQSVPHHASGNLGAMTVRDNLRTVWPSLADEGRSLPDEQVRRVAAKAPSSSSLGVAKRTESLVSHRKETIGATLTRRFGAVLTIASLLLISPLPVWAHVGSPDVFLEGSAGPYRLFVTVRVPQVIPGVAQIEIRSESNEVREIRIAPMQLTGPGSKYAPAPDVMQSSKTDPQFFTGNLWLMEFGSLQVRVEAEGARGKGQLAVPVPAVAQRTLPMQKPLGVLLFVLMLVLGFGLASIASAAVREGDLAPGMVPPSFKLRRARFAMIVAAIVVVGILFIGAEWWKADDSRFARRVYSPPELEATLTPEGRLNLHQRPARIVAGNPRRPADIINSENLIPDHGHLMHFFMIRTPQLDSFWHLHPLPDGHGDFALDVPPVPPGHYQLFADVVLTSGFPVTMVGQLDVPAVNGKALAGDDSGIVGVPISQGRTDTANYAFSDGGRMVWKRAPTSLKADVPRSFQFEVLDKDGEPARDLEPYMGMAAHAEIIRSDGSVFAHVHPAGSVSMAALDLAQMGESASPATNRQDGMAGMNMMSADMSASVSPEISIPYGFPKAGLYRIFVQIKRAGRIETAVFDATAQ